MEIKEKIIDAASRLFHRYGVRSVSMDDIAHHLSISKKTIYQEFKDKDEIVTTAFKMHMEMEKEEYDEIQTVARDPIDELTRVSVCMRKDFRDINPSLLFDIQKYHAKAWQCWLDFKNNYVYGMILKNLEKGIEMGYFRKDINVNVLSKLRLEQVQMAFDTQLFPPAEDDLATIQMQFFEHFIRGILSAKGTELYEKYQHEKATETL